MADLAAADVTVTIDRKEDRNGMRRNYCTVSFGDGALTYPSGGVPLAKAKLGMARHIAGVSFTESNTTDYHMEYDLSAETVRLSQTAASTSPEPLGELAAGSDAPAAQVIKLIADGY